MIITFHFNTGAEQIDIRSYRKRFASIIKSILEHENNNLYKLYYSGHQTKPFTFSTYFKYGFKIEKSHMILRSNEIDLNLTSIDNQFIVNIYNGILKNKTFDFFGDKIILKRCYYNEPRKINSEVTLFKTKEPFILKKPTNKGDTYIKADSNEIGDNLEYYVKVLYKELKGKDIDFTFNFRPVSLKKQIIKHYDTIIDGISGEFYVESDKEILEFMRDAGVGARRGQGFGMLEVIQ